MLFFSADDGIHGNELWSSDGTADGTAMVKDINPASDGRSNPVRECAASHRRPSTRAHAQPCCARCFIMHASARP